MRRNAATASLSLIREPKLDSDDRHKPCTPPKSGKKKRPGVLKSNSAIKKKKKERIYEAVTSAQLGQVKVSASV
jgi:hypothetical protein